MLPIPRRIAGLQGAGPALWLLLALGGWLATVAAAEGTLAAPVVAAGVVSRFEEWRTKTPGTESESRPFQMEGVVYYYDALWQSLWLKCGDEVGYLAIGTKDLGLHAGQRVRVEGHVSPTSGRRVEGAKVTVLPGEEALPAENVAGHVAEASRFTQRMVVLEGLVDRQSLRDLAHLEFGIVAEGQLVLGQVLVGKNGLVPQLQGKLVRARGMYYARRDADPTTPKLELWIERSEDVQIIGSLERDARFDLPLTAAERLGHKRGPGELVRIEGTLEPATDGRPLRLRSGSTIVGLRTPQISTLRAGDRVEAIGLPIQENGEWWLGQALFRDARQLLQRVADAWSLPEEERRKWQRLRAPFDVYYYDPLWKGLWGGSDGNDDYVTVGDRVLPIKAGQRVLLEGLISVRDGLVVEDAKATVVDPNPVLEAADTQGQISDTQRWDKRFVAVEGYVDRQLLTDTRHVELDLLVGGRMVVGRLLLAEGQAAPNWEGSLLRAKGVFSATADPMGGATTIELWCSGTENVKVLGSIEHDRRFAAVPMPIERLATAKAGEVVHIAGVVRAQQPGKSLTIRDETGQVVLHTAQAQAIALGARVEAIGVYAPGGAEGNFIEGFFRRAQGVPAPPPAGLPKLRLADQLRELLPEEAARAYPVQLSGVVTWTRANADFFFIRDVSGGVCVFRPPEVTGPLTMGAKVDVVGVSASGKYTPVVLAASVTAFSTIELPEPRPVTLEQAMTGVEEAQWVSMSGYVRGVEREGPWARIVLSTAAGEFSAMLAPNDRWTKLPGAVVRVRGVCSAEANSKRQLTGIRVWVPSSRLVEVEEAAPEDPYAVPARSISSLGQYSSLDVLNRRIRVSGVVIHQTIGRRVHIQEGNEALLVLSRDPTPLAPGDRIEAVGFPGRRNNRIVLREAVFRRTGAAGEPKPVRLKAIEPLDPELDGRVVSLEGTLLQVSGQDRAVELVAQQGATVFTAKLESGDPVTAPPWQPHSRVALTGVYELQFDEYLRPHSAAILLRSPADVKILRPAPWWTAGRALGAAGVLTVGLVLGFGWVVALRRRVQRQTELIRAQIENEKAARLEAALSRASKLESLGLLAGGIAHDFNNLLTVVIGNLSLARLAGNLDPDTQHCLSESERAATRAKDLTQQLLTFAKGGEPIRKSTDLTEVVREATQFALHGAKVRCEFEIAPDLWPADVDPGQIGQVVNNLIINATQAMPGGGLVRIEMSNEVIQESRQGLGSGRYLKTRFIDNGSGISPENLPRIFEPYFTTKQQGSGLGLATVYSIIKRHRGHVEVTSEIGVGTTFCVWLPAATEAPDLTAPKRDQAPAKTGRVLFMDDEEAIRMVAAAVLKRQGLEVTAVGDGAAVVREFQAARAAGRPFDLVILDLTVPGGMGGAEAMEKLRQLDPQVRAIVASGYSSDPVMANYQAHGFRGRVPKPYQASDLMSAVDAVLHGA